MKVAVTGASGRMGRLVAARLLDRLSASDVILISRTPSQLDDFARRGAVVRAGDFEAPETLPAAFKGVETLLLIGTHGRMDRVAMHKGAIDAAKAAGVRHVSYVSFSNPAPENPFFASETNRRIEADLRDSGMTWTMLRDSIYSDLRIDAAFYYIADGKWPTNMGAAGRHAFVWRDDCAAAATASLLDARHANKNYEITGPALVSGEEYLALLNEFGGRKVTMEAISDADHPAYLESFVKRHNRPDWMPELHTSTGIAIREGHMSMLTSAVQDMTGQAPRTLRALFEVNRDSLRRAAG